MGKVMGERRMTARTGAALVSTALLCAALAMGLPAVSAAAVVADQPIEAAAPGAADDGPATLRDAVQLLARHFDFTVVGASRLGTDAPSWPAEDLGPEATLDTLLKDYGYIIVLKPETSPGAAREPATLMIVGLNHAPAPEVTAKPAASAPMLASAGAGAGAGAGSVASMSGSRRPSWAPRPSTVVRALTKLATTNSGQPGVGGDQSAQPAAPLPNPAQNTAAMAALTHSAQAGLGALVTGLRQACPNPKGC
jgi:hypothetical protein